MNERTLQMFTMFLNGPASGHCEIVDDGTHEAVIIDLDGLDSPHIWLDVRRKFHGPVIVLSVVEKQLNNAFWVAKPVNAEAFGATVKKVHEALSNPPATPNKSPPPEIKPTPHVAPPPVAPPAASPVTPVAKAQDVAEKKAESTSPAAQLMSEEMDEKSQNCCGELQDPAYRDSSAQSQLFFDPATTLLGIFREAMRLTMESGVAKIERTGAHPMYVGSGKDFASTPMPEPYLRAVCARSISESPISVALVDLEPKAIGISEDPRLRRLDNMLWKISLWSSRGRVPLGTSLTAPIRLRRWPNIPRLLMVPHGMRIASLWRLEPSGLLVTAQKLGIPYRFVFSFYTACQSFGLVEQLAESPRETSSATQSTPPTISNEKRGLFGSLLKKLGFR